MDLQVWSEEIDSASQNVFELPVRLQNSHTRETEKMLPNGCHASKLKKRKGRNLSKVKVQDGGLDFVKLKNERLPDLVECPFLTRDSPNDKTSDSCNSPSIPKNGYTCDQCGKEFHLASHLKTHSKVHASEKNFCCTVCDRMFVDAASLRRHIKKHSGEKPYRCEECGKTFSIPNNFKKHVRTHTGEKPYVCPVCQKSFSSGSNLKTHLKSHAGERPYSCNVCNKTFTLKGHLVTHHKIHYPEKTYSCHKCERSFRVASSLKRHLVIHEELGSLISARDAIRDDDRTSNKFVDDKRTFSEIVVLPCTKVESPSKQKHAVASETGGDVAKFNRDVKVTTSLLPTFGGQSLDAGVTEMNSAVQTNGTSDAKKSSPVNRRCNCPSKIRLLLSDGTKTTSESVASRTNAGKSISNHLPDCDFYISTAARMQRNECGAESNGRMKGRVASEQIKEIRGSSQIKQEKYVCSACSRQFNTSTMLEEHLRSHDVDAQFTCKLCTTTFTEASSLGRHMRKHVL